MMKAANDEIYSHARVIRANGQHVIQFELPATRKESPFGILILAVLGALIGIGLGLAI